MSENLEIFFSLTEVRIVAALGMARQRPHCGQLSPTKRPNCGGNTGRSDSVFTSRRLWLAAGGDRGRVLRGGQQVV